MNNIPTSPNDPVNTDILLVAEDRIKGFRRLPFHAISEQCGHPVPVVIQRLKAMMEAGVVRRVRQTLLATKLAQGALVAWSLPEEKLDAAFDWMKELDPFTGHVVLRNTDAANPGANYRLWTTVKVPVGCGTPEEHCGILKRHIGADGYVLLPARGVFALGVGHMRRRGLRPGEKLRNRLPCRKRKPYLFQNWNGRCSSPSRNSSGLRKWWKIPGPSVPPGQDWKRKNTAVRRKNWTGSRSSAVSPLFWNM